MPRSRFRRQQAGVPCTAIGGLIVSRARRHIIIGAYTASPGIYRDGIVPDVFDGVAAPIRDIARHSAGAVERLAGGVRAVAVLRPPTSRRPAASHAAKNRRIGYHFRDCGPLGQRRTADGSAARTLTRTERVRPAAGIAGNRELVASRSPGPDRRFGAYPVDVLVRTIVRNVAEAAVSGTASNNNQMTNRRRFEARVVEHVGGKCARTEVVVTLACIHPDAIDPGYK